MPRAKSPGQSQGATDEGTSERVRGAKAHVGIRVDDEMMVFLKKAGIDLMEAFPGVAFTQSDVIRLMLCGAEREIKSSPAWLRRQVRGEGK